MSDLRDVVLVTVDSWRADHCGFMGYDEAVTPTLDEAVGDGLVFENAIAPAPETNSSVLTSVTGFYGNPCLESDVENYTDRTRQQLRSRRTLAERFRELGYTTAGFTANPWTSRYFNFDRGFDYFADFMDENLSSGFVSKGSVDRGLTGTLASLALNWWQGQDMFMNWEAIYDEIDDWLADADSPYFCWIFLVDVHMPYLPPADYRSRSRALTYPANLSLFAGQLGLPFESLFHDVLVDAYDDTIRYTDAFVERLLEDLDGDPLIAIHADHGEAFGERGIYGHGPGVSEAMLHVPFVVLNGPTGRVERPVSMRRLPELLPALAAGEGYEHVLESTTWARNYDPAIAIRGRRWRYEWRPDDERVWVREDGDWVDKELPELAYVGRELVEYHTQTERERGRVMDAAADVAESPAL